MYVLLNDKPSKTKRTIQRQDLLMEWMGLVWDQISNKKYKINYKANVEVSSILEKNNTKRNRKCNNTISVYADCTGGH